MSRDKPLGAHAVRDARKKDRRESASKGLLQNEEAYDHLKRAITSLALRPGEYINTAQLMDSMAMGRTPINHALHRLMSEGLIQIIPRKGVLVAPLSVDEAFELIEVRLANERLCARLAAERAAQDELDTLESLNTQYDRYAAQRDINGMLTVDGQFHEVMATAARNRPLADILRVLHARAQRFWAVSLSSQQHASEVSGEHRKILQALRDRDGDAAADALAAHINSFRDTLLQGQTRLTGPLSNS